MTDENRMRELIRQRFRSAQNVVEKGGAFPRELCKDILCFPGGPKALGIDYDLFTALGERGAINSVHQSLKALQGLGISNHRFHKLWRNAQRGARHVECLETLISSGITREQVTALGKQLPLPAPSLGGK